MNRRVINRRAFLTGAGTVAIGLPFLEGLPSRSAWAADAAPVFTFFVVGQNGVVGKNFFPSATGALTTASLAGATGTATSVLSAHAANLLFLKNINYPAGVASCGHAEGNVQTLTGLKPGANGNTAYASGPSADTIIGKVAGKDPIALYSGAKGFIAERISFKAAGSGQVRAADVNPYILYSKVVGLAGGGTTTGTGTGTGTGSGTGTGTSVAQELANRRKSVNDIVRAELQSLLKNPALSSADINRVNQHFQAIRDIEVKMDSMTPTTPTPTPTGAMCSKDGLPVDKYEAYKTGFAFKGANMEEYVKLHLQIMAVAFGCNYNRVGTLQWGDGTDGTVYNVPSNSGAGYGWTFHQLSHRIKDDVKSGNDATAEAAHHEIDTLRMQSFLVGIEAFKAHGLENNTQLIWTNTLADGPSHSTRGVPMIIWGNGGGYIKQGAFVDTAGAANAKILNTIIAAATRGSGTPPTIDGSGEFAGMKA
ncbi:MAG TPA: DUF1552 domain-containing protein [Polyangiaceae bacterium]|nr:DUF1552 domain-containing protein [Polyangiaceae bacterium]